MSWEHALDEIAYIRGLAAEMGGPERAKRVRDITSSSPQRHRRRDRVTSRGARG